MILIVGLGNPGKKFQKTRHNIGFSIVNSLQLTVNRFSNWKKVNRFQAEISEGEINGQKVLLAKPLTFMNLSGLAIKKLFPVYCSLFTDLWVVHDDIDLSLGKIKIAIGRGAAGHKGVKSIIKELGIKDFVRVRVGISQFAQNQKSKIKNQKLDKFVLKKFTKEEEKTLKRVIKKTIGAIEMALKEGIEKAMNKFN